MNKEFELNIHEQREYNKSALEAFFINHDNNFDYSADKVIKNLRHENRKSQLEYDKWENMHTNDPQKWAELQDDPRIDHIELEHQKIGYLVDIHYREEEIIAFLEMKIIYAFKHVEINLKRLIKAAYPETSTKGYHHWENIIHFLKSKSIKPEKLPSYAEINELRELNNFVKHSHYQDMTSINHILEFSDIKHVQSINLEIFYNRIKTFPNKFLQEVLNEINKELFSFNEDRVSI